MNKTYNNLFELLAANSGVPQKLLRILDNRFNEIWAKKEKRIRSEKSIEDDDFKTHQRKISEQAFDESKTEWTQLVHSIGGEFVEFKDLLDSRIFSIDPYSLVQKNSREIEHPLWIAMEKETALKIVTLGYLP